MVVFFKPNSALSDQLRVQHWGEPVHYEAELCFVVEQGTFTGVTLGLDLTKRQLQTELKQRGLPWERSKAFDGSVVLGDFVPFEGNGTDLELVLSLDGTVVQQGDVSQMIHSLENIRRELASFVSLEDGDVVMTGTPKGVGPVVPGSIFSGQVRQRGRTLVTTSWVAG